LVDDFAGKASIVSEKRGKAIGIGDEVNREGEEREGDVSER
jgi:hypothetical protein